MASLTFSAAVMDDIRAAMRQHRQSVRAARTAAVTQASDAPANHPLGDHGYDDSATDDGEVYGISALTAPNGGAKHMFDSWVQDLDDQTLPELDNDELRILHALLFGAGDDAFAVADELLKQTLTSSAL